MLDHDVNVVRRTSVPLSKLRTTTMTLFYVACQRNYFLPVRGIAGIAKFQHPKRKSVADSFLLCSKVYAVEQDGRLPSLVDKDEERLEG